jgi:hypothetical protein
VAAGFRIVTLSNDLAALRSAVSTARKSLV